MPEDSSMPGTFTQGIPLPKVLLTRPEMLPFWGMAYPPSLTYRGSPLPVPISSVASLGPEPTGWKLASRVHPWLGANVWGNGGQGLGPPGCTEKLAASPLTMEDCTVTSPIPLLVRVMICVEYPAPLSKKFTNMGSAEIIPPG